MKFTIALAGHLVRIYSIHEDVFSLCKDYVIEDSVPEYEITIVEEDIDHERVMSEQIALAEGQPMIEYSPGYLETLAVYRKIAGLLQKDNVMLFHGCVVAVGDEAYLFTAPSGTGKSTHARLWLKNIPGAKIINGDKPLLGIEDGQVMAYGTPWNGKEGWGENAAVPLKAICLLERGETNHIDPIRLNDALPVLIKQSLFSGDCALHRIIKMIARMDHLRFYRLQCNMDDEAAWVSYKGMSENDR